MAVLEIFTKRPSEQYSKPISYAAKLPAGATISSVAVSAVDMSDNASAAVVGAGGFDGSTVLIPVQGGVDGKKYLISYDVTLSNGNVLSDQLVMHVWSFSSLAA